MFLYDLREGLGQGDHLIDQNRRGFARKLYGNLAKTFLNDRLNLIQQRENPEAEYLELLETQTLPFNENKSLPITDYQLPITHDKVYLARFPESSIA